ncbi:MAG: DUF4398 domain-containing protein [Gammaproteobacteria bacterium]|nr:DUF4398 domain-containing protein [Gammaproteobacteria bacterium]
MMLEIKRVLQRWVGVPILFGALVTGGCATSRAPVEDIARVETAINGAKNHGADIYAPLDLRNAQEHLEGARKAMSDENYEKAKRLAAKAMAEAEAAEEKALTAKTQKLSEEMRENVDTLRREVDRAQQQ